MVSSLNGNLRNCGRPSAYKLNCAPFAERLTKLAPIS
jgi:hypothetical protein